MQQVLHGPTITHNNPDVLFSFSQNFNAIVTLKDSSPGMLLVLQEQTNFDVVTNRLDGVLNIKWNRHRIDYLTNYGTVEFQEFVTWIRKRQESISTNKTHKQMTQAETLLNGVMKSRTHIHDQPNKGTGQSNKETDHPIYPGDLHTARNTMILREHKELIEPRTRSMEIEDTSHSSILPEETPQNSSDPYMNQLVQARPTIHAEVRNSWKCNLSWHDACHEKIKQSL